MILSVIEGNIVTKQSMIFINIFVGIRLLHFVRNDEVILSLNINYI